MAALRRSVSYAPSATRQTPVWHRSSFCASGQWVEVARLDDVIVMRDSKDLSAARSNTLSKNFDFLFEHEREAGTTSGADQSADLGPNGTPRVRFAQGQQQTTCHDRRTRAAVRAGLAICTWSVWRCAAPPRGELHLESPTKSRSGTTSQLSARSAPGGCDG